MKTRILRRLESLGLLIVPLTGCGDDLGDRTTFTSFSTSMGESGTGESGESGDSSDSIGDGDGDPGDGDGDGEPGDGDGDGEPGDGDGEPGTCQDGEMQSCYTGLPETEGVGVCLPGTQTCEGGVFGACVGETLPTAEACDNIDNDCNGTIDEGNPGGGVGCATGMPGVCSTGLQNCVSGSLVCTPSMQPAPQETCFNNLDDNCNGSVDEFCFSCPYVYAYDGSDWRYETSVGGASLVGRAVHLREGKGKKVRFSPIWVRLDSGTVLPDRSVRAEILAAEDETVYVDHAQLTAVHHPRGHEIVSSSSIQWTTLAEKDPRQLWAFPTAECRPPTRASWCGELDVRDALAERTDVPVHYELARENVYELEFGPVHDARRAWLLIDGWKYKRNRGLPVELRGRKPTLEIRQADGSWLQVKTIASQRGDRKTIAIDLSALSWPTGSYQLRLNTGTHEGGMAMWYLDRVRLVEATPAPLSVSKVVIGHAELSFRGAPTMLSEHDDRPRHSRNDGGGEIGPGTYGAFTRYGDVTPLLRDADDRVVVMRQGDVVSLRFDHVPEPPPGFETTLFLRTNLVYKTRVAAGAAGPTELTANVGPMPRHHMGRYEADAKEREDAVYREYLARWNTRKHSPAGEQAA